jgi:protein phosphatase
VKIRDDIALGQHSHVGMARTENQDFFGFWESDDDREFDVKGRIAIVCDGMGGHAGGEVASRLAVQTILKEYQKDQSGNIQESLRKSIEAANAAIQAEGKVQPKLAGMGSTCTALVHRRDMVYFGQVGDSRGYLIRGGKIKQMTKDHSLVQELVDQGLLDKSEMETHPDKNVILRSLGVKPSIEVDVSYVPASVGDVYLICSDGLSGPVSEAEMLAIVNASNGDLRKASEGLIDLANKYGGFDNITVQLVRIEKTDTATTDKTQKETLTGAFTQDQVAESIAKAKAERDAKKGGGKKPAAKGEPAEAEAKPAAPAVALTVETPAAAVPKTEMSVPAASIDPGGSGGGGGGGKLALGLVLGLAIGGAGGFVGAGKMAKPAAASTADKDLSGQAAAAAAKAQEKASGNKASPAYKRGEAELSLAQDAAGKEAFGDARAHYTAATALFEVAAEGK